jgi:hypothetical protein
MKLLRLELVDPKKGGQSFYLDIRSIMHGSRLIGFSTVPSSEGQTFSFSRSQISQPPWWFQWSLQLACLRSRSQQGILSLVTAQVISRRLSRTTISAITESSREDRSGKSEDMQSSTAILFLLIAGCPNHWTKASAGSALAYSACSAYRSFCLMT